MDRMYGFTSQGERVRIYRHVSANDHYVVRLVLGNGRVQRLARTLPASEITLEEK